MANPNAITITVKGIKDLRRGLRSLQQPEFQATIQPAFKEASRKFVVPAIKNEAKTANDYSPSRSRLRGKRGQKGPLAKKVTTKLVKRRHLKEHNALFAYSTKPRAWYAHMVIKGTKVRPSHPRGSKSNDMSDRAARSTRSSVINFAHRAMHRNYLRRAKAKP